MNHHRHSAMSRAVGCRSRSTFRAALILAALALPPFQIVSAIAQPSARPANEPAALPEPEAGDRSERLLPVPREALRQRLNSRLEDMDRLEGKLREALALIDDPALSDSELAVRLEDFRSVLRQAVNRSPILSRLAKSRPGFDDSQDTPDNSKSPRGMTGGKDAQRPDALSDSPDAPPQHSGGRLTPEQTERAIAWLEEHMPRLASRMLAMREQYPEAFARLLARMKPRMAEMERLLEEDPDLFRVRLDEWRTSMGVIEATRTLRERVDANAEQPSIDEARASLRVALAEQFEAQIKSQELELSSLRQRFESLDAKIKERRAKRDAWIDKRATELAGNETDQQDRPRRKPEDGSGR